MTLQPQQNEADVVSILVQRLRRWPSINETLVQRLRMFAVMQYPLTL